MCIKFPYAHVHKRSQILMLRSKPFFSSPRQILCFPFIYHIQSFLPLAIGDKPLSLLRSEEHNFCDPIFPFFFLSEIKDIFQFFLIFTEGDKKGI